MRKMIIGVLILVSCVFSFYLCSNGFSGVSSLAALEEQKLMYDNKTKAVEGKKEIFKNNKATLTLALAEYKENKQKYDSMAEYMSDEEKAKAELGDYYDLEYLWTVIGVHAIREGVSLGLVCTTSAQEAESDEYIYANLNFTVEGEYRSISEFIERCEDDDSLYFPISKFKMIPYEPKKDDNPDLVANYLSATFTIKDVPLSTATLEIINSGVEDSAEIQGIINTPVTDATADSNSTNTTGTTNGTNTNSGASTGKTNSTSTEIN